MSRELKFRAWDKKDSVMRPVHGVLAKIEWGQDGRPCCIGVYEYEQINDRGDCDWNGFELEKEEFDLMQYTGLKDKNGVEIYEGDYLKHYDDGHVFDVEWDKEDGEWGGYGAFSEWSSCEVIGNIYENSELLSQGE